MYGALSLAREMLGIAFLAEELLLMQARMLLERMCKQQVPH